jgi:hypothetical protein
MPNRQDEKQSVALICENLSRHKTDSLRLWTAASTMSERVLSVFEK